jgi:uncharacterized protein YecT (DUF1311 family)
MKTVLLILLGLTASVGHAASFDCTKSTTAQEKAICASPALSAADDRMAAAYKDVLLAATAEMRPWVLDGQREWIHAMEGACVPGDPAKNLETCLQNHEDERTQALRHMVLRADGATFIWHSITRTAPDNAETLEMDKERANGVDHGTLNASWPQAAERSAEWLAWNKAIEAATVAMAYPNATPPPAKWSDISAADIDIDLDTSIGQVGPELVTAAIDNQWYGHGAAHPNHDSLQFNWMLNDQREMKPADVFQAGSGWSAFLQTRCDAYLHKTLDTGGTNYESFMQPGVMAKTLHQIVENPQNWSLNAEGITIVFQPYAVACYACTPDPVTIPWADLKPMLRSGFPVPAEPDQSQTAKKPAPAVAGRHS